MRSITYQDVDYRVLNLKDTNRLIGNLAQQIIRDNYRPDVIVAVRDGGREVADRLVDELKTYGIKPEVKVYQGASQPFSIRGLGEGTVLIVDDVYDKVETAMEALEEITSRRPLNVRVASLIIKSSAGIGPQYSAEEVDKNTWVVFPWEREKYGDLINTLPQQDPLNRVYQTILSELS